MPAAEQEDNRAISLWRASASPGNSSVGSDTIEVICGVCGDDPALDYQEVSSEIQQIRGPYTLSDGIAAFVAHNEFHEEPTTCNPGRI